MSPVPASRLLLLAAAVLATAAAAAAASSAKPARLVRGQEEWPESVGCPTGYVPDLRPKALKQKRPGHVVCAKGNIQNCVIGTHWYVLDRRFCFKCTCVNGKADCLDHECPPPKPVWPTRQRYQCRRGAEKVCPSRDCKFLSRDHRCVFCDCGGSGR
ncbi:uncharacterized protein LOC119111738 [Pollicipes pollicipes]|uniref:uncharacterized protein LOC119111738 n=1 Tax=Pollicipes pollicipes TaxID=41117 RepID=UPI0018857BB6|nr:uncharacterized protein LOC119111738 [Pollicipes pollicipes]